MKRVLHLSLESTKIEFVRIIYSHIVGLNITHNNLFIHDNILWSHNNYKSILEKWLLKYSELFVYYHKNLLFLRDGSGSSDKIHSHMLNLDLMKIRVKREYTNLKNLENNFENYLFDEYYKNKINEKELIESNLGILKNSSEIINNENIFKDFRIIIEEYFQNLFK